MAKCIECDEPFYALDRCIAHYTRHAKGLSGGIKCLEPGCEERRDEVGSGRWLCPAHDDKRCASPGCLSHARTKGLCHSHYNREWRRKAAPPKRKGNAAQHKISLRKYRLTPEQYAAMSEAQGHVCAICKQGQNDRRGRLFVDHNATTGAVRALLCQRCNSMLGYAQESLEILAAGAEYLRLKNKLDK